MAAIEAREVVLSHLKCNQYARHTINEILESYPSLVGELQKCIENGAEKVEVGYIHSEKPKVIRVDRCAMIYINH